MTRPIRIFVVGTTMAGRLETLRQIGRLATPPFDPYLTAFGRAGGWEWSYTAAHTHLVIRGKTQTAQAYDVVRDADKDERFRAERDFVANADVFIYVADSQSARRAANIDGVARLRDTLILLGREPARIPLVFQLNKRDLPKLDSESDLKRDLVWPNCEYVSTIATKGVGIAATLIAAVQLSERLRIGDS